MEAIVRTKVGMPTLRIDIPEQLNTEYVIKYLDMADELCEVAALQIARETPNVPTRGLGLEKIFRGHSRPVSREVLAKLGGTIYCNASR